MNNEYLANARKQVPDAKTLIVLASKRARVLANGAPPMVRCKDENFLDVALLEIAGGTGPNLTQHAAEFHVEIGCKGCGRRGGRNREKQF